MQELFYNSANNVGYYHCLHKRFLLIDLRNTMYTGINVYVSFLTGFIGILLLIRHKKAIFSLYYKLEKSFNSF